MHNIFDATMLTVAEILAQKHVVMSRSYYDCYTDVVDKLKPQSASIHQYMTLGMDLLSESCTPEYIRTKLEMAAYSLLSTGALTEDEIRILVALKNFWVECMMFKDFDLFLSVCSNECSKTCSGDDDLSVRMQISKIFTDYDMYDSN